MIQQRYGNNIPLRIAIATQVPLIERKVEVSVIRKLGRKLPFTFSVEDNTILGIIYGKDMPNREDILSIRITMDAGTERQQIIDVPNAIALVSKTTYATMTATQMVSISTDGYRSNVHIVEQPRKKMATRTLVRTIVKASQNPSHESMAKAATPDIILS